MNWGWPGAVRDVDEGGAQGGSKGHSNARHDNVPNKTPN